MGETKFSTNDHELIQTIKDSVPTEVFKDLERGKDFTSKAVHEVPRKALVGVLQLATLSGLIAYLTNDLDAKAREGSFVQVVSPTQVQLHCTVEDREDRRFTPVTVSADVPSINLLSTRYVPHEQAIIELQSLFVATEEQKNLIRILGTIVKDDSITNKDDGVTQEVQTRSGVKVVSESIVNPVTLAPFRTFAEIAQPSSAFIVRIDKDPDIEIALYEADGGAWRNAARASIRDYLEMGMGENGIPVIA